MAWIQVVCLFEEHFTGCFFTTGLFDGKLYMRDRTDWF